MEANNNRKILSVFVIIGLVVCPGARLGGAVYLVREVIRVSDLSKVPNPIVPDDGNPNPTADTDTAPLDLEILKVSVFLVIMSALYALFQGLQLIYAYLIGEENGSIRLPKIRCGLSVMLHRVHFHPLFAAYWGIQGIQISFMLLYWMTPDLQTKLCLISCVLVTLVLELIAQQFACDMESALRTFPQEQAFMDQRENEMNKANVQEIVGRTCSRRDLNRKKKIKKLIKAVLKRTPVRHRGTNLKRNMKTVMQK